MPGAYLWAYDPVNKKWLKVPCATDGTLKVEITNMKFWQLEDTPNEYTGQAGKGLRVKSTEDGLEFVALALKPHGNEAHAPDMFPLSTSAPIYAYMGLNCWLYVATSGMVRFPRQSNCWVYATSDQSIPVGAWTKVDFHEVMVDIHNEFSLTDDRFTVTEDGVYIVATYHTWHSSTPNDALYSRITKNGSEVARLISFYKSGGWPVTGGTVVLPLVAGDYIEAWVFANSGGTLAGSVGPHLVYMQVVKVA